jgi:Holliday junction resolvasome RuvABC endonuclease subunit
MGLSDLVKPKAQRVIGIDASTSSIAFGIIENGNLVRHGKIVINGNDIYEKIYNARKKIKAMKKYLKSDYIVIEGAVFVQSADVVIKLSYVYGSIISQLMDDGTKVVTVIPTAWQNFIGNKPFKKEDKAKIRVEFPGKSDGWYSTKIREIRKQKTMDWVNNKFNLNIEDNDVGDAIAIAHYAYENVTSR